MRLFWPNARFESIIFALDVRALLRFNYDKPSRIFPCILLTRNHMISSAIWNKQALVNFFQRPQIALALRVRAILLVFKKI